MSTLLISTNDKSFSVNTEYLVTQSGLIQNLPYIPQKLELMIEESILGFVCDYIEHNKHNTTLNLKTPILSSKLLDSCKDVWHVNFIEQIYSKSKEDFLKLCQTSDYLHITSLLYLCCAKIATTHIK